MNFFEVFRRRSAADENDLQERIQQTLSRYEQVKGDTQEVDDADMKGFDTKEKRNGIGITNMMMRAESLNGSLTIRSNPDQGCEITVKFPLIVCEEENRA